jgi:hypothetical protein
MLPVEVAEATTTPVEMVGLQELVVMGVVRQEQQELELLMVPMLQPIRVQVVVVVDTTQEGGLVATELLEL